MCEIYDDGSHADVFNRSERKAAKVHRCESCCHVILPGERYSYASGVFDHRGFSEHGCLACAATRDAFGKVHHFYPAMDYLDDTLVECIAEGDAGSAVWKDHLEALRARMLDAHVCRVVAVAFAELLGGRKPGDPVTW